MFFDAPDADGAIRPPVLINVVTVAAALALVVLFVYPALITYLFTPTVSLTLVGG